MNRPDLRAQALAARVRPGCEGAEVGVYRGEMSLHLFRLIPGLTLHMVDWWAGVESVGKSRTGARLARMTQAEQDDAKSHALALTGPFAARRTIHHAASVEAAAGMAPGSLDFAFLDADHSYESVRDDIAAWLPLVRPGGLLGGHDYGMWESRGFGVRRAVDEACARHGWHLDLGEDSTWFVRV